MQYNAVHGDAFTSLKLSAHTQLVHTHDVEVLCISYNICTHYMSDMYALSPWGCGPWTGYTLCRVNIV